MRESKHVCLCARARVCVLCSPESLCISTKLDKSALIHMRETRFSGVIAHHETDEKLSMKECGGVKRLRTVKKKEKRKENKF